MFKRNLRIFSTRSKVSANSYKHSIFKQTPKVTIWWNRVMEKSYKMQMLYRFRVHCLQAPKIQSKWPQHLEELRTFWHVFYFPVHPRMSLSIPLTSIQQFCFLFPFTISTKFLKPQFRWLSAKAGLHQMQMNRGNTSSILVPFIFGKFYIFPINSHL